MPINQPKPGGEDELNSVQQWELLQCQNMSCFLALPSPLGLAACGQSLCFRQFSWK